MRNSTPKTCPNHATRKPAAFTVRRVWGLDPEQAAKGLARLLASRPERKPVQVDSSDA